MIKTPTWYVFHMYRHHQNATLLESSLTECKEIGIKEWKVPAVSVSSSIDEQQIVTITLSHLSESETETVELELSSQKQIFPEVLEAYILTAGMNQCNTFFNRETVKEEKLTSYTVKSNKLVLTIPPCSVVEIRCKIRKK